MTIRSLMSFIMVIIEPEHPELFTLEVGKIAEFDFVYTLYTLASTNINQSVPNLNTTISSWMSLIMDVIRPELSKVSALEFENLPSASKLVTVYMKVVLVLV